MTWQHNLNLCEYENIRFLGRNRDYCYTGWLIYILFKFVSFLRFSDQERQLEKWKWGEEILSFKVRLWRGENVFWWPWLKLMRLSFLPPQQLDNWDIWPKKRVGGAESQAHPHEHAFIFFDFFFLPFYFFKAFLGVSRLFIGSKTWQGG